MVIALDDDLAQCTDFDVPAIFATTPTPTTINGIFTEASDEALMFGQVAIEASDPSFTLRTALMIPGIVQNIGVTIGGVGYTVRRIQKVGTGQTVLYLKTT